MRFRLIKRETGAPRRLPAPPPPEPKHAPPRAADNNLFCYCKFLENFLMLASYISVVLQLFLYPENP